MFYFLITVNFLILFFFKIIEEKFNIYDFPNENKIHLKKTSLFGGSIFIINISLFLIYNLFFKESSLQNLFGFSSNLYNLVFILSIFFTFFLGLVDDKKNISATTRLIFLIIIISINLLINPELNIKYIKLSFLETFYIENYSFFWTLICYLLFINAFNFFDGINLQTAGLIFAISLFFFIKNIFVNFFGVIIIANIFFSYLNYKSKTFLGNSGSFFLPFLFGSLFISAYNNQTGITSDEIVLIMFIPGIDLMRLFFLRLLRKQSPFKGDQNHIHHYLIKNFSPLKSLYIVQILIWIPFIIFQISGNFLLSFVIQIIAYTVIIIKYRN